MSKKERAKIVSLVLFITGLAAVLLTSNQAITTVHGFSAGPPAAHTGAPGESNCVECHTGTPSFDSNAFSISAPSSYEPGKTYQIMVKHTSNDGSRRQWGFQLTALAGGNKAGSLQPLNNLTHLDSLNGRQYIEHTFNGSFSGQGGGATWTFNWVAPSSDVGPVIFYAGGNQADQSGTPEGDRIYLINVTVNPAGSQPSGPPKILSANVSGKKLVVMGESFGEGATLYMCETCETPASDGNKVKKVSNDSEHVDTLLVAKKAGKEIARGQTVMLQVKNPDGTLSDPFSFTR
jgi:Reeler domain